MEKKEILEEVQEIFRDVLDNEDIEISESSVADDIDEWDSLSNIQLVIGIEKHFKIRFLSKEITLWENVGEMIDTIKAKLDA